LAENNLPFWFWLVQVRTYRAIKKGLIAQSLTIVNIEFKLAAGDGFEPPSAIWLI